jgi:CRP-like cAMP-binding protein
MDELLNYMSQFGKFDAQEAKLAISKLNIIKLHKDAYFSEAGSVPKRVGFVLEGVLRGCYSNSNGDEITRCFIPENNLCADYPNFEESIASSEYIQACTDCTLIVFSKSDWEKLSHTLNGWDIIKNKMVQKCMYQKSRKNPVISQDATSRYSEFLQNYPGLINSVPLSYVASYLGVTQQSLSRIRKNIR